MRDLVSVTDIHNSSRYENHISNFTKSKKRIQDNITEVIKSNISKSDHGNIIIDQDLSHSMQKSSAYRKQSQEGANTTMNTKCTNNSNQVHRGEEINRKEETPPELMSQPEIPEEPTISTLKKKMIQQMIHNA